MADTRVYLEVGETWVFAAALDWPGWCRRGKGEQAALDTLAEYADRYAAVAGRGFRPAGSGLSPGGLDVVGTVRGGGATDFGALGKIGPWDAEPLDAVEADRQAGVLEVCWRVFDEIAANAPARLRKGPRGGGRDTDGIVDHVRESERSYGRSIAVRMPPGTPWRDQRTALAATLRAGAPDGSWPARYAIRRIAWHVLDHAWEIEDKSTPEVR